MYRARWFAFWLMGMPLAAHHNPSTCCDTSKIVDLTGVITKVEWQNPHVFVFLEAQDRGGASVIWAVEIGSPGSLMRQGATKQSLEPGGEITVGVWVAKHGSRRATAREGGTVKLPDGKMIRIPVFASSGKTITDQMQQGTAKSKQ